MGRHSYLIHLLAWLAFIVAVRFAMMLWTEWLAGLVLLLLPFYLVHDSLLWRWKRRRGPLFSTLRHLRLRMWHKGRRLADELDALPHKPHGYCPKCGYHLHVGRCPECGHEVTHENILAEPFNFFRQHRSKLIAAATAMLLFGGGYIFFTQTNWLSRLSKRHLVRLHKWGYQEATYELDEQICRQTLTTDQLKELIEDTLVASLSIPSPYPHDADVPCRLQFKLPIHSMQSLTNYYIQDWVIELDGVTLNQAAREDLPRLVDTKTRPLRLAAQSPGRHRVCIYGEVILAADANRPYLPQTPVFAIPFTAETSFEADKRTALEMIEASMEPLVEGKPDSSALFVTTYMCPRYDHVKRLEYIGTYFVISSSLAHPPPTPIAGHVLVRPKGATEHRHLGTCYVEAYECAYFDIGADKISSLSEELEIRIEPDAREAAFLSEMRCRRFYGKPVEVTDQNGSRCGLLPRF